MSYDCLSTVKKMVMMMMMMMMMMIMMMMIKFTGALLSQNQ